MASDSVISTGPRPVMPVSPGIAIGPVRVIRPVRSTVFEMHMIGSQQVEAEQRRLRAALEVAVQELGALSVQVAKTVGQSEAAIFEAQQLMLEDPAIVDEALLLIAQQHLSVVAALHEVAERQARELEALDNEMFAARGADVRDAISRVLRHLQQPDQPVETHNTDTVPVLIVAHDLTPSDTASFDAGTILGICTVVGGPTTHAAILARAMELPAVAGCDPQLIDALHDGQQLAIDGTRGLLYLRPDTEQAQVLHTTMQQQQQARWQRQTHQARLLHQPGATADGCPVQIFANVGNREDARRAAELGAEGIGLLRTEFLFNGRQVFPNEQEQFESYVDLFRAFGEHTSAGKTIIARTLDAGADKPFPALEALIGSMQEANPALGLRGARIHLAHEYLLREQLRALLRAAGVTGIDLAIMFPMIATLEEVRCLRATYASVRNELERTSFVIPARTPIGIMVETPAAAVMATALAREVDFFSIGANDLFQYTMAVDRTNSRVTGMFGLLEPAVWRLIALVVQAGVAHDKPVAVCGELAADARIGPLLAGLGVKELSMSPPAMLKVKSVLSMQPMAYWRRQAQELLKAETAADVQALLESLA